MKLIALIQISALPALGVHAFDEDSLLQVTHASRHVCRHGRKKCHPPVQSCAEFRGCKGKWQPKKDAPATCRPKGCSKRDCCTSAVPTTPFDCNNSVNFVLNAQYSQISLNDEEAYAGTEHAECKDTAVAEALAYCKAECLYHRSGCTGFFFQKHTNGHEICGFYSEAVNATNLEKHVHQQCSQVCILQPTPTPTPTPNSTTPIGAQDEWLPTPADELKRSADESASFYPSAGSRAQGTPCMTGFKELNVEKPYEGEKKILLLGTSKFLLPCTNGKLFNTGHHSTETLVPMYHFDKAGFKFDVATEDGAPLALEEWTFPLAEGYEDKLHEIRSKVQQQLEMPRKYSDISESLDGYAAVFIPGGHGPLIDMHTQEPLGRLLRSAHAKGLTTISLCHGPTALRAAAVGGDFPYKDYKIAVFPDAVDKTSPSFGYLPGPLRAEDTAESHLKDLGCKVQNTEMDDTVVVDRELITGASQLAAQKVAEAAVQVLVEKYMQQ